MARKNSVGLMARPQSTVTKTAGAWNETGGSARAELPATVPQLVEQLAPPLAQQLTELLRQAQAAERPAPRPRKQLANGREWTVAIYMVADGPSGSQSLDAIARAELDAIYDAARDLPNVHVAVQLDLSDQSGIVRFVVDGPFLKLPEQDATARTTLGCFFDWIGTTCPAERYAVIFWGHSSGPVGLFGDRASLNDPLNRLTLDRLRRVLDTARALGDQPEAFKKGRRGCGCCDGLASAKTDAGAARPIDIVLFKNCWMSTLETAFELQEHVEFMIGSQAKVPQIGWPYERMFKALNEGRALPTRELADVLLQHLGAHYQRSSHRGDRDEIPYTLAALGRTGDVEEPLAALVEAIAAARRDKDHAADFGEHVSQALENAVRGDPALVDVRAFCRGLRGDPPEDSKAGPLPEPVRQAAERLDHQVDVMVTTSPATSTFGGLSLFHHPREQADFDASLIAPAVAVDSTLYSSLLIHESTRWDSLALDLFDAKAPKGSGIPPRARFLLRTTSQLTAQDRAARLAELFRELQLEDGDDGLAKPLNFTKPLNFAKPLNFDKALEFAKALFFPEDKPLNFANPLDAAKGPFLAQKAFDLALALTVAQHGKP
jgi:hypothetical protein